MVKGKSKNQIRIDASKRQLFLAGMGLFAEYGYENVSVDDIAEKAHSSKASFYNYFRNKDELFVYYDQAQNERYESFYQTLLSADFYYRFNGLEKLYALCMYVLSIKSENAGEFTRVSDMRALRECGQGNALGDDEYSHLLDIFISLLEHGKKDGSISRSADSVKQAEVLINALLGVVFDWEAQGQSYDMTEKWSFVFEFLCSRLAAES